MPFGAETESPKRDLNFCNHKPITLENEFNSPVK